MKLKEIDAFPNCPGLSKALGLKEADIMPPRVVGWGPWKKRWYSICSRVHPKGQGQFCKMCLTGSYRNNWKSAMGSFVYAHWYGLWYWWANKHRWNRWGQVK